MKFSTLYLLRLLKEDVSETAVLKELIYLDRKSLISKNVVLYILRKKDIPLSLYENALESVNLFFKYSNATLIPN